jgi:apolipoprotein N-acyltransferase
MVLGCPDYDLWWLGFVAWVPWLASFEGATPRRAFLYGWLCGTITVFWGFFWLSDLLTRFADFNMWLAVPVTLLFALWQGLLWALPAAMIVWLRRRTGFGVVLLAPLCWVAIEALLPNIFPVYMALIWAWQPLWIQVAELGGPTTIAFVLLAINAALYVVLRALLQRRRPERRALVVLAGLLVGVPLYGKIRIAQVERVMAESAKLQVGVVQGNMSIREMHSAKRKPIIVSGHQEKSAELEAQGADLIVWSETSFPYYRTFFRDTKREPPPGHKRRVRKGFDAPMILGTITTDRTEQNPYPWNSALLIDARGQIAGRYDKVFLLVFGEYIPIVDPEWFRDIVPAAAHLNRGPGPGILEFGHYRLGPLICYEDILPRFVRDTANEGVHALVNLTNDSWFGLTAEPAQHLGLSVFRAIEQRRGLVRSVSTGISSYVDPTGRVHVKTRVTDPDVQGPQDPDGFLVEVPMIEPGTLTTPYARTGELFNVLVILGLVVLGARRRRKDEPAGAAAAAQDVSCTSE